MKKMKILCLAAAIMLTLAACVNAPEETETPTNTPTPTERPVDKKTVAEHKKIAERVYQAVRSSGTYRAEMMVQDDATYMSEVLGLDPSWYDVAIVEIPMMSTNVDMFALIHPTEGNFENVEAAIKGYQDFLINDSIQYPMNEAKVRNCKAVAIGDYMFFILLTSPDKAIEAIEEVLGEKSK